MKISSRSNLIIVAIVFTFLFVSCLLVPVGTSGTLDPLDLARQDSRFIELLGLDIHYTFSPYSGPMADHTADRPVGREPLILLLHGFGASSFSWRDLRQELSRYADVIAYDRPAFGLSERPVRWKGPSPYGPENQLALAVALMDELGYDRAIVVGHSAGGTIALSLALERPERVAALVLVSPAAYIGGGAPAWIRPLFFLPSINHLGPLLARRLGARADEFLRSAWFAPELLDAEVYEGYRAPLMIKNWEKALWELTKASRSARLEKRISSIGAPSLVISGDSDTIVPIEQSIRLARELPKATLVVVPQSGHVAHEESPQAFLRAFEEFWSLNFSYKHTSPGVD
ncbi:MAG TPA: alpha/beta hydrolase [Spirochaetaceae bacterium]|jgi:pimeloyl-ACP methyl ester carboxylesterase|nr:alpha/beta hydrolase [Spirochaetaceae bacterium]